jgi:hypothetical protein
MNNHHIRNRLLLNTLLLVALFMGASALLFAGGTQEVAAQGSAAQEPGSSRFVEAAGMKLLWEVSGDEMIFTLQGGTTGWVAVGINPSRVMKDAQIVIAYVADGDLVGSDHFGTGIFSHKADTELGGSDDVRFISGEESDGVTTVRFALPLDSGDSFDTLLTPGKEHLLLLSRGPNGADNFSSKHAAKGKVKAVF